MKFNGLLTPWYVHAQALLLVQWCDRFYKRNDGCGFSSSIYIFLRWSVKLWAYFLTTRVRDIVFVMGFLLWQWEIDDVRVDIRMLSAVMFCLSDVVHKCFLDVCVSCALFRGQDGGHDFWALGWAMFLFWGQYVLLVGTFEIYLVNIKSFSRLFWAVLNWIKWIVWVFLWYFIDFRFRKISSHFHSTILFSF